MNTSNKADGGTGAVRERTGRRPHLLRRVVVPWLIFCVGSALTVTSYYRLHADERDHLADHFRQVAYERPPLPYSALVLLAGLSLSGLGAIYLVQLGRHAARRERLVAQALEANEKLIAEVAERKRAESALRAEHDKAQSYLDLTGTMFVAINANETVTLINRRGCDILGLAEADIVGQNWFDRFVPSSSRLMVRNVFRRIMRGDLEPAEHFENPVLTANGSERMISWHNAVLRDSDGRITGALGSGLDITGRQRAEQSLAERERQFRTLVEYAPDAILLYDADGRAFIEANANATAMLGYSREEFLAMGWEQISAAVQFDGDRTAQSGFDLEQQALEGGAVFVEWVFRASDGRKIQTELRLTRLPSDRRRLIRASLVDITARKAAEQELKETNERLESLAGLDSLTDLPNRRRLLEALDRELQRVGRYGGSLSVVSLDADHLKPINDAYGHDMGDKALIALARVLEAEIRDTDFVARYGGDEFVILMPHTPTDAAVMAMDRIRSRIAESNVFDVKRALSITVSAGISEAEGNDGKTAASLLKLADEALYAAKHAGRNCTRTWRDVRDSDGAGPGVSAADRADQLQRRVVELMHQARDVSIQGIWSLVQALEARDAYTRGHSDNVTRYAVGIAEAMDLEPRTVEIIRRASMVHDIGKIGVPDVILQKPGKLTPEELATMQAHALAGVRILQEMSVMELEVPLVRCHHERWDGHGYPDGVSGDAIPMGARIISVADALDAITSDRVYRKARDFRTALEIVTAEAGKQFDADVVAALQQWVTDIGLQMGWEDIPSAEQLLATQASATALNNEVLAG